MIRQVLGNQFHLLDLEDLQDHVHLLDQLPPSYQGHQGIQKHHSTLLDLLLQLPPQVHWHLLHQVYLEVQYVLFLQAFLLVPVGHLNPLDQ